MSKVQRIEPHGERLRVIFEHQGKDLSIAADRVVNGAGRVANIDGLDLEKGNVAHQDRRIATDAYLRSTSNPNVYVCGDALTTSPQLSPIATYEGEIVGRNIVEGPKYKPDYASIPSSVYTTPALASVGLSEQEGRLGLDVGLAVNPETPVEACLPHLPHIDLLLMMTVHPGFGGQAFIADVMDKVKRAREEIDRRGLKIALQVDGGINEETAAIAAAAGADVFVAGSAIFHADDPLAAARRIREAVA